MLSWPPSVRIFLAAGPADMRRGFDGLARMTSEVIKQDPFSGALFVFRNRRGDRVKVLYWAGDGFALWYRRLERGTFRFPACDGEVAEIRAVDLTMILEGIDPSAAPLCPATRRDDILSCRHPSRAIRGDDGLAPAFSRGQNRAMETAALPDDLATCHGMIRELAASLSDAHRQVEQLGHRLDLLLRRLYGPRSERVDPQQLLLFADQAEGEPGFVPAPESPAEPPARSATGRAKGHGRRPLPADLPRERRVHEIPPDQRACPECGEDRSPIGEEISEQLDYRPASLFIVQHVRVKVACRHCQAHVAVADKPPQPIEKGLPGPGLLAQVITSKFADHLPLYRQEEIFARHGVELSRKTLCGLMAQAAWLLEPIWKAMKAEVLRSRVVQTDDTTVPVLDRRLDRARTARLWLYLGDREHPYAVYDYTADRSRDGPERFLGDFKGYLQADAYSGYGRLFSRGVVEVGCFAHARRKFFDARTSDPERAHEALARIRQLYAVEVVAKHLDDAGRLVLRRERSVPFLERLGAWLDEQARVVLPKSPIGAAIGYARSNWAALNRFTEAGYLSIDNNASERAVKPVALGRNYADSEIMRSWI